MIRRMCYICAITAAVTMQGVAGTEVVLKAFPPPLKGAYPYAGLFRDSSGNPYGTTDSGGASNTGSVYRVNTTGHETVLYRFTGGADGCNPRGGVVRDSAGNLYGTTFYGGAAPGVSGRGVVHKVDTTGHETVMYIFSGGADGGNLMRA